jgi:hypothetical protein
LKCRQTKVCDFHAAGAAIEWKKQEKIEVQVKCVNSRDRYCEDGFLPSFANIFSHWQPAAASAAKKVGDFQSIHLQVTLQKTCKNDSKLNK